MKPSQLPWKWLLLGPVAVLLVGIVSAPWILGDQTRFADAVAERISAWSEGRARFIGPVQVSILPEISVRGRLELTDSKRLPFLRMLKVKEAKASLDLPELLRGRVRIDVLRLQKPKVQVNEDYASAAASPDAIVSSVLSSIPAHSLFIRNGEISLASEPIKHIHAHVDAGKDNGALAMLGFFSYRQERVRVAIESGSPTKSGETELVPLSISISSTPVRGKLSSTASFGPTFKLDGGIEGQIGDLRRFWRWIGYKVPEGPSLKGLSLAGGFHFSGSTFAVENGVFTLDGNRAIGVVALTAKTRPRIEGTLAFDQLMLDPYFDDGSSGTIPVGPDSGLDALLLRYIDADLRISANAISVKSVVLGSGGFTVSARNGAVASEIGELELCGGRASGRVDLDLAGDKKTLGAAATVSEISLEPCLAPFSLGVPVQGIGDLTLDLSAEGNSQADLIGNLSGNISVSARAGTVPVDLPRFLATSTPVEATGWRDSGSSSFDRLQADCALDSGRIHCETLSLQTGDEKVAVAGDIDLPKGTLNWDVSVDSSHGPVSVSAPALRPALSIRGPLLQPSIRRTDRASFGEGRAPSQEPNQVQPH